jgi:RNA polymerase sigma-70 factor (ECF subfamily)
MDVVISIVLHQPSGAGDAAMARSAPHSRGDFPTTNWTNVRDAGAEPVLGARPALDELLRRYWPALWAHLVYRKRVPADRAEDLVQSFVEKKILQRNLVGVADPGKGRFRTFLLTALDRFLIDCRRKECAVAPVVELSAEIGMEGEPDVFGVAWAMQVLIESLRRMQSECALKQRPDLWGIFAGRTLAVLGGTEPLSYQVLAERYGLHSDKQAANRYHTAEVMFQRCCRAELADYAGDDLDAEAADFRRLLCEAGPELVEQLSIDLWKDVPEVTLTSSNTAPIAGSLARLLELPRPAESAAALLEQVLTGPMPLDLDVVAAPDAAKVRAWASEQGLVLSSFAQLLHHPSPRPELLELVKDFAKEHRSDPESPLGREVATVLYYATLAAALTRCGARITRHDDDTLRQGFRWGHEQPWVDEATRGLFREGLQRLEDTAPAP